VQQSAADVEALVREDLGATLATALDFKSLFGTGANNQPLGILNQPGISRWTFGADPLFDGYLRGVIAPEDADIPMTNPGWIANPRCWASGISTPKFPNTGITVISENDTCLGYRYFRTTQIPVTGPTGGLVFFGDWPQLLLAQWGTLDILVDPYTLAARAMVRIVLHTFFDCNLRYPEAFAVSTDPGYGSLPPMTTPPPLGGVKTIPPKGR
jgi:HK97 family phage major capsid protein